MNVDMGAVRADLVDLYEWSGTKEGEPPFALFARLVRDCGWLVGANPRGEPEGTGMLRLLWSIWSAKVGSKAHNDIRELILEIYIERVDYLIDAKREMRNALPPTGPSGQSSS